MSSTPEKKRFSTVRYWRYVFTPLLLLVALFGLYILFTAPDAQTAAYKTLVERTNVSLGPGMPSSPAFSNIMRGIQSLSLNKNPSAP